MSLQIARWTFALLAVSACGSAAAHHSYAQFDRCKPVSLEGEITSIDWVNPHIVINMKTGDAQSYRIEWSALQQLAAMNVATGELRAGDHVVITGSEHRDPAVKVLTLLTEIRRPSDGWTWLRNRPVTQSCEQQ